MVVLCVMCNAIMAISPAIVLPILNACEHEVANLGNVEGNEYFLQDVLMIFGRCDCLTK